MCPPHHSRHTRRIRIARTCPFNFRNRFTEASGTRARASRRRWTGQMRDRDRDVNRTTNRGERPTTTTNRPSCPERIVCGLKHVRKRRGVSRTVSIHTREPASARFDGVSIDSDSFGLRASQRRETTDDNSPPGTDSSRLRTGRLCAQKTTYAISGSRYPDAVDSLRGGADQRSVRYRSTRAFISAGLKTAACDERHTTWLPCARLFALFFHVDLCDVRCFPSSRPVSDDAPGAIRLATKNQSPQPDRLRPTGR